MSSRAPQASRRVLVIDDNHTIHADFQKILCPSQKTTALEEAEAALFGALASPDLGAAFKVDSAMQGKEGLERVRQAVQEGRPYAMAFIDVRMPPGWDGIETAAKIWETYPDLQVVICTAYSDYSWDEMLANVGQSDRLVILKKPFDNIEVLQLANALTEKWRLLQEIRLQVSAIDTPVQRCGDNTRFLQEAFTNLIKVLQLHAELVQAVKIGARTDTLLAAIEIAARTTNLEFLAAKIPKALQESLDSVERVTRIVRATKEFSR